MLKGHTDKVMSVVNMKDGRLASGSWDRTVRIWGLHDGCCEQVLKGTCPVWSVASLGNTKVAAAYHGSGDQGADYGVAIWGIEGQELISPATKYLNQSGFSTSPLSPISPRRPMSPVRPRSPSSPSSPSSWFG